MRHVDPVTLEDVPDLEFEEVLVGKDVPAAAEHTVFRVVLNGSVDTGLEFIEIGLGEHGFLLLVAAAPTLAPGGV
jgi:hypothetical protein